MVSLCGLEKLWQKVNEDKPRSSKPRRSSSSVYSVYAGYVPGARNTWSYWIDYIMAQRDKFGFIAAVMITRQGSVSAFTPDFVPTPGEIEQLNVLFDDVDTANSDLSDRTLSFDNRTYVIRSRPDKLGHDPGDEELGQVKPRLLVAFSGSRYLLVCRSISKYIVVLSEGRRGVEWLRDVTGWLYRLTEKLIRKQF